MAETAETAETADLPAEVIRLNKIIGALMDRAERSTSVQSSDFGLFETTVILEERVRRRTAELEAALLENEKVNRDLRESEAKFRGLVSQSLVGIVLIEDGIFNYSNARFDEMFGYSDAEVRQLGPLQLTLEADRPFVAETLRGRLSGETDRIDFVFRGLRKNGESLDVECHSTVMHIGSRRLLVSMVMDISTRVAAEREVLLLQDQLREQSTHDALTGLYNRRFLDDSFARELLVAERSGQPVSVIMSDLDNFKLVNDRYGHLAGDEVLRVFGDLMKQHARASDIFCRYGGEEFLLILPGLGKDGAALRAEQLRAATAALFVMHDGARIEITSSFGVAAFPVDGRTSDQLVAAADAALYSAKAAGRNRVQVGPGVYRPDAV